MKLGNKHVRYAVIDNGSGKRQVIGAKLDDTTVNYTNDQRLKIKNTGSTGNVILFNETKTDKSDSGSYIVKDSDNNVKEYGWIDQTDGTTVSLAGNDSIATHVQSSATARAKDAGTVWNQVSTYTTAAYMARGNFDIVDWTNLDLSYAFMYSKGLRHIPSTYPSNAKNLSHAFYGTNVVEIPSTFPVGTTNISWLCWRAPVKNIPTFENLTQCTDIRCAFEECEHIESFNLTRTDVDTNLKNVKSAGWCFNGIKFTGIDFRGTGSTALQSYFYRMYITMRDSGNCTQHDSTFGSTRLGQMRYTYEGVEDATPYSVCFIPTTWGGMLQSLMDNYIHETAEYTASYMKLSGIRYSKFTQNRDNESDSTAVYWASNTSDTSRKLAELYTFQSYITVYSPQYENDSSVYSNIANNSTTYWFADDETRQLPNGTFVIRHFIFRTRPVGNHSEPTFVTGAALGGAVDTVCTNYGNRLLVSVKEDTISVTTNESNEKVVKVTKTITYKMNEDGTFKS